jgi:hypothetical protein
VDVCRRRPRSRCPNRPRYIYRPNSDLYVIYNQTTGRVLEALSYSLQVKLTYDFTF